MNALESGRLAFTQLMKLRLLTTLELGAGGVKRKMTFQFKEVLYEDRAGEAIDYYRRR